MESITGIIDTDKLQNEKFLEDVKKRKINYVLDSIQSHKDIITLELKGLNENINQLKELLK